MPLTNNQQALYKLLNKHDWRITRDTAEEIVECIASDSAYSEDEQDFMNLIRDYEMVWYSRGTEAFMNRLLSNLNLRFHREEQQAEKIASLNQAILQLAGEGEIDVAKATAIFNFIQKTDYNETNRLTVQYLYNSERMTADAKSFLKKQIATSRAKRAHQAWVEKKADAQISALFGGDFQGAKIDMAKAQQLLAVIFADYQYSDAEKETMQNLYRNANWEADVKEFVQDEIHSFTNGMSLDGSVVDIFMQTINESTGDLSIDAKEAGIIIADLKIGSGLSQNKLRTIQYCIQTFPSPEDVQTLLEQALENDGTASAQTRAEATKVITEAATKGTEVENKETKIHSVPSTSLMAVYNSLKNAKGQITASQADAFIEALFTNGTYTKKEQETMRILRAEGAFTAAANREILLSIRRYMATKNFAKK